MIRSMTGFGSGRGQSAGEAVSVEIRSVNGKFCEVKPHLPRELFALEGELVRTVKGRVARGVVDVHVRREGASGARTGLLPRVDLALAAAYVGALREMKSSLGLSGEPSVHDVATLEGVLALAEAPPDLPAAAVALEAALGGALSALEQMRRREGEALARDLGARLDLLGRGPAAVGALAPQAVEGYRDRLATRVADLSRGGPADPSRLAHEVAFVADRTDVAEELTRLSSHLSQLRALLASDAPAGRKLEFLLQEVHREVNTIGSKAQHASISAQVVELKAELERVREQIQNIE
ncbi:MAG: YicC family protein [Myxococcales bacterium]